MTTRSLALPASLFFLLATGAAGCAPKVLGACDAHSDCDGGKACIDNACVDLCQVQSDCPANAVCGVDGHCVAPQDGPAPEIADVRGNDTTSDNNSAIANGLLVTGSNLATARFELRGDDGSEPLAVAYRYDTSAELYLPGDIRSGTYTLVATNLAGSDQEGVTLQLPELTGNMIVERLNTDATEQLSLNALPVGTGSSELALGDHDHDDVYARSADVYSKSEVDAAVGSAVPAVGFGLASSGSQLSVDTSAIQSRVTGTCPAGHAVTGINENGTLVCEPTIVANFVSAAGADIDHSDWTAESRVTVSEMSLTLPGPGSVFVTINADRFFSNSDVATNTIARQGLYACKVPDSDSDCGPIAWTQLYALDEISSHPTSIGTLVTKLDYATGGKKTIYFNAFVDAGDFVKFFRVKMAAYYVPVLSP